MRADKDVVKNGIRFKTLRELDDGAKLARISHQDFGSRCICSVSARASGLKSIAIAMV